MAWFAEPAVVHILLDANRVAPRRSHATDGIIGDATHAASVSDHNPDTDGGVHACDITHDPAGGFDAWAWAHVVAQRIIEGKEHRVKYLVSNSGTGPDMIFNPSVSLTWRQNGSYKTEHRSHLHVSILYTDAAEQDVSDFFVAPGQDPQAPPKPPHYIFTEEDLVYTTYQNQLHGFYVSQSKDLWQRWEGADGGIQEKNVSAAVGFQAHNIDPSRGVHVHEAPNGDLIVGVYGLEGIFNEARWALKQGKWLPHTFR